MNPLIVIDLQGVLEPVRCPSKQKAILVFLYLRKKYHDAVSLKELSLLFTIRPDVLSREFKKQYGVGPLRFVRILRVEEAQRLLGQGSFTIKEICYQVGFSNPQAFCKVFKRLTLFSPTAYREYTSRSSQV